MYEVKVRDNLFIAHSLNNEFFGPAKNLHGATYVIDLIVSSNQLSSMNVVIDIGLASKLLKECINKYNYKNLDEVDSLKGVITTTEFLAYQLTNDFIEKLTVIIDLELLKALFSLKYKFKFDILPSLFSRQHG